MRGERGKEEEGKETERKIKGTQSRRRKGKRKKERKKEREREKEKKKERKKKREREREKRERREKTGPFGVAVLFLREFSPSKVVSLVLTQIHTRTFSSSPFSFHFHFLTFLFHPPFFFLLCPLHFSLT